MLRPLNHRVLLLTEEFPPEIGGIQSYLSQLWSNLPDESSLVIAKKEKGDKEWDEQQKYKIIRIDTKTNTFPRWKPALKKLREAVEEFKPEVIVCGKALFEGRAAYRIWKEKKIPYVVITHAMEINTWLSHWKTKYDLLKVLNNAARVLVVNQKVKEILIKNGVSEKKFVKMYPGVDDFFAEKDLDVQAIKDELGLVGNKVVVTVSRMVKRKGIDVALLAMPQIVKEVPNVSYVVIGDGPELEGLKKLAKLVGTSFKTKFLGSISREKIRKILQASDLFLLTPRDEKGNMEGFGIVYMEAAASGLCSVGSKSGGVPEAVIDGQTGILVDENNADQTAAAVIKLLKDDDLRKKMSAEAQERALKEFVWSKRSMLFKGVIDSIVLEKENNELS